MQNGTSDGLLFYLAGFSSLEMLCVLAHACMFMFSWKRFFLLQFFLLFKDFSYLFGRTELMLM